MICTCIFGEWMYKRYIRVMYMYMTVKVSYMYFWCSVFCIIIHVHVNICMDMYMYVILAEGLPKLNACTLYIQVHALYTSVLIYMYILYIHTRA